MELQSSLFGRKTALLDFASTSKASTLSRSIPRAKSHSHPHLVSSGFTPSSPPRAPQDSYLDWFRPHLTRPQGPLPVASEVTAKTLVRMHLLGLGDIDAPRDHLVITSHRPLLGLLPGLVLTTPDQAPWASPSRIQSHGQNLGRNAPPQPWGCGYLPRSLGQYVTIAQPRITHAISSAGHLAGGPGT